MLDVTLLGTGGTMPTKNRRLSSAYFRLFGKGLLMDCGEGTQVSLRECGYTFKPCGIICFTHFHADHISGLPGFLLSMGNEGRTEPVNIIGPSGVAEVVNSLRVIAPELPFEIRFTELCQSVEYLHIDGYKITAFRVKHNKVNNVHVAVWSTLQKQTEATLDGVTYTRDMVMGEARRGIAVTYCTDTRPCKNLEQQATFADLFICEGMYAEDEKLEKAQKSMHMTFSEACGIADMARAEKLWLTHFSPSLAEPQEYAQFADSLFKGAQVGYDGMTCTLMFK